MILSDIVTQIVGTYRKDFTVGDIVNNSTVTNMGETHKITFKVIRKVTEMDWRNKYNYFGSLPKDLLNRSPEYFEIQPLD